MAARSLSLQDHFLNSVRRAKLPVTIFLVKGVKLQGVITWFDAFSVLLRREGASQLVYKHSISTIMPGEPPLDFVATTPSAYGAEARLEESEGLAEAIGIVGVAERAFRLRTVRPASLLGKGQVDEVAGLASEHEAGLLIVDAPLSPVQQKNLEQEVGAKVIDRTGL